MRPTHNKTITAPCETNLGEVPALDEVSAHIAGGLAVDHGSYVMPRHPGGRVAVDDIWAVLDTI